LLGCFLWFGIVAHVEAGAAQIAPTAPSAPVAPVVVATNTATAASTPVAPIAPSQQAPSAQVAPIAPIAPPANPAPAATTVYPNSLITEGSNYLGTNSAFWITNPPYGNAVSGYTNRLIYQNSLTNAVSPVAGH
jgi:hypothetical protein